VFGRFLVDGKPLTEFRLGRFSGAVEEGTNALLDRRGNFAFLLEPGAYYLASYEPLDQRTRLFDSGAPPDPVFQFEVSAGQLRWLGAWEEGSHDPRAIELRRRADVQPLDVLRPLVRWAAGSVWEPVLRSEVDRLAPAAAPNP
jgi:hypothetical protein